MLHSRVLRIPNKNKTKPWKGVVPSYNDLQKLVFGKEIKNEKDAKIIELGCGDRKYPGAVGLDKYTKYNPDVMWDLNEFPYPFESGSVDLIITREVLEHLHNVDGFINEISRMLMDDGILYLTTNNRKSLINKVFKTYETPTHCSLQNIESLKKLIPKDLEIVKIFCLPYSDQARTDIKYKTLRLFRILLHHLLPNSLQERIILIAVKRSKKK